LESFELKRVVDSFLLFEPVTGLRSQSVHHLLHAVNVRSFLLSQRAITSVENGAVEHDYAWCDGVTLRAVQVVIRSEHGIHSMHQDGASIGVRWLSASDGRGQLRALQLQPHESDMYHGFSEQIRSEAAFACTTPVLFLMTGD
jgi:hypothetical protein